MKLLGKASRGRSTHLSKWRLCRPLGGWNQDLDISQFFRVFSDASKKWALSLGQLSFSLFLRYSRSEGVVIFSIPILVFIFRTILASSSWCYYHCVYRATPTHEFDLVVSIIARHFCRFTFNFFRLFSISILSLTASSPVSLSRTSSWTFIWLRPFLVSSEQSSIFSLAFIVQGIIVFQKHSLSQGRARWCSTCAWRRTSTRENTWIWGRSWRGGRQGTLSGGVRRAQSRHHTLALLHLYHLVLQSCPSFAS